MCDGFLAGRNFDTENSTFLTLNETGGGCSTPPKRPPNTTKFRDFSYFYLTSLKTKKQDFWFFTAIFSVSKGMVLKKTHHLTHIFNPIPNRVNLSLNRPFYFYYFFKKFFPVKKSQRLDFLDFEEENKADQPPNTKIKTLFF